MTMLPLKILAVDSETLLLKALKRAFRSRSLDLSTAMTTSQAYEAIKSHYYDLFILDFDPKDRDQQLLLSHIDSCCPFVPIIFMTTCDPNSTALNSRIRELRRQGEWHLLEKPFHLNKMFRFIKTIFQNIETAQRTPTDSEHNYDQEKRQETRRPRIQPVTFSYMSINNGQPRQNNEQGIVTDVSNGGIGLLTAAQLRSDQVIHFADSSAFKFGSVCWCTQVDHQTCRAGIQLF
jgi:DNA-binding NtrC family response regulator